jgi:PAS domain S-box-containing protein
MQENEILLKAIIDGGRHSIIVMHADCVVRFVNKAAERLYGYPASHFIGKHLAHLRKTIYDPGELEAETKRLGIEVGSPVALEDVLRVTLSRHEVYETERTAIRSDGTRIQVLVSVTAMKDEAGEIVGFLSFSLDISERKQLEQLKNEFISTVSHELRTPLTSIRGALGLMVGGAVGALPKAAGDLAELAYRNSERLVRIINDILDMDKIDSGKFSFDIRPFDVAEVIHKSLEENLPYGEKHDVRFVLKKMPEGIRAVADPDRVLQVMANLLSNAAKFSPRGGEVWVNVENAGPTVRFSVRDFGKGIPESFRSRVFEKFAQSESGPAQKNEGTGLGLSITQKMVEGMGGAIVFETEADQGTTFTFTLPQEREIHLPTAAPVQEAQAEAARILICEDDPDIATLLRVLLEREGFPADVAHSLGAARLCLGRRPYAALMLDLMLPDGDGLQFLTELRENPDWKTLPVVVISAKSEEGRREYTGGPVELVDWISKPINESALMRSLQWATRKIQADNPRVLHVEDNKDLRKILQELLQGEATCIGAGTLKEAQRLLKAEPFDLVILDLGLPDGSGLELLENFDTFSNHAVPVLILSASEPADAGIRQRVAAVLLKSRVSEERMVETVLKLIKKSKSSVPAEMVSGARIL